MAEDISWPPPGPGRWVRDTVHFPDPLSHYVRAIVYDAAAEGLQWALDRYGIPRFPEMQRRFVHGRVYSQRPARDANELAEKGRACEVVAEQVWKDKVWREDLARWRGEQRSEQVALNLAYQDEEIASADDASLIRHVRDVTDHLRRSIKLHFALHGADSIPVGDFISLCTDCGLTAAQAAALLAGASPASTETVGHLRALASIVGTASRQPTTLTEVAAISDESAALLENYRRFHGGRVVSSYDITSPTLWEQPRTVLATILAMIERPPRLQPDGAVEQLTSQVRETIAADKRKEFDLRLVEARLLYGLRDDNVGLTFLWPLGLARRALLEVGRRATDRGVLADPSDALDALAEEVPDLLALDRAVARDVAARSAERRWHTSLDAPVAIGEGPSYVPPDLSAVPRAVARAITAFSTTVLLWTAPPLDRQQLRGVGIGTGVYRGTARVILDPLQELDRVGPGDVLVTRFTTPAFNALLPAVGALVTEEGGSLSHAALISRELGLPAVIGAAGVLDTITDGEEIEVDTITGEVRAVISAPPLLGVL